MRIACLGDSLTEGDYGVYGKCGIANVQKEGYPYFLQQITGAEVLNFGKCGYTSTSYLEHYKAGNVDVKGSDRIIIMLGTNGGLDPDGETQGNEDYRELLDLCMKDAPMAKIYICTPPHVTDDPAKSGYGCAQKVRDAVGFVKKLGEERSLQIIDTAACAELTDETEDIMQPNDGVHFGKEGYRTLAGYIAEHL